MFYIDIFKNIKYYIKKFSPYNIFASIARSAYVIIYYVPVPDQLFTPLFHILYASIKNPSPKIGANKAIKLILSGNKSIEAG